MTWKPPHKTAAIAYQETMPWPDRGVGVPPAALADPARFTRDEISFSIARNIARSTMRPTVTKTLARNASNLLSALVDRHPLDLTTLPELDHLGDQALNAFAHDVAVGIAGLCMERLGFIWRAHAKEILPRSRRPDYVWTQALVTSGVTLSEVKGMAGSTQSFATLKARIHEAFDDQVDGWKSENTPSGTPIVGGYAIGVRVSHSAPAQVAAVRSRPVAVGPSLATSGASPVLTPLGPDPLVIRHHFASTLALMGLGGMSRRVVGLEASSSPIVPLELVRVEDQSFVVGATRRERRMIGMAEDSFRFAMHLERTETAHPASDLDRPMPPVHEIRSVDLDGGRRASPLRVLAPDGLALIDRSGTQTVARGDWLGSRLGAVLYD